MTPREKAIAKAEARAKAQAEAKAKAKQQAKPKPKPKAAHGSAADQASEGVLPFGVSQLSDAGSQNLLFVMGRCLRIRSRSRPARQVPRALDVGWSDESARAAAGSIKVRSSLIPC